MSLSSLLVSLLVVFVGYGFAQYDGCNDVGAAVDYLCGETGDTVARGHDVVEEQHLTSLEEGRIEGVLWLVAEVLRLPVDDHVDPAGGAPVRSPSLSRLSVIGGLAAPAPYRLLSLLDCSQTVLLSKNQPPASRGGETVPPSPGAAPPAAGWWACLESDQGPRPYQGRALTN